MAKVVLPIINVELAKRWCGLAIGASFERLERIKGALADNLK